jgi:membrane associated rhomboid family serine protease
VKASRAWLLLCALHGVASMLLWWGKASAVDLLIWRTDTWTDRPWTLWTSAWVHVNTPHLIMNQIALGALTAFAWVIRPTLWCAIAWALCWPLAQVTMLLWPQVGYAVGLSGVLHAGAMVLAVQLLLRRIVIRKARRWGGLLMLALLIELLLERGWSHPVVWDSGNETSVVQAAHLTGAFWGLCLGLLAAWWPGQRRVGPPAVTPPSARGQHPA